jgi:hypothetical protein
MKTHLPISTSMIRKRSGIEAEDIVKLMGLSMLPQSLFIFCVQCRYTEPAIEQEGCVPAYSGATKKLVEGRSGDRYISINLTKKLIFEPRYG